MKIDFYKINESNLISYFCFEAQVGNNELRELNGFKVRNILSIAFNSKIRDLILENLFNQNGDFLSIETKDSIFRYLSSDEIYDIKSFLSNYLDYQIESSWYDYVCQVLTETSLKKIVISSSILNNVNILSELKLLFPKITFYDWRSIDDSTTALFLDYNQSWKKRNIFNYKQNDSIFIFLKHFFENVYRRKIYNDELSTFNVLNGTLRRKLFGDKILDDLKDKLNTLKPDESHKDFEFLHENDDKYYNNSQEEVIIHYSTNRSNKFRMNASLLLFKDEKYIIDNPKNLLLNTEMFENNFYFSHLDNIIDDIDLNELNKAIDKDDSINQIIQPLWEKFNLNENDGRLWKQLLKRKVQENSLLNVYSEIEKISTLKNFVSLNTFENTYCNPSSDTIIPRERRVFKAICRYLELPVEYRVALQRERILIGGHSQELHLKLKPIVESMVMFGVFDNNKSDDKLLEVLNEVIHNIEENVDIDYFGFTRDSLIYACIALYYEIINKMKLKPIIKIDYIIP